jgi:hypothetical protein
MVIDPLALLNLIPMPPPLQAFFGGLTGGNSTFVLGNNTTVCLGRTFDFKICPVKQNTDAVTLSLTQNIVIGVLYGIFALVVITWAILYAAYQSDVPTDDSPCEMVVGICEGIAGALQGAILIAASVWDDAQKLAASGGHVQVAALDEDEDEGEGEGEDQAPPDQPQVDQPQVDQPQVDQPQVDQPQVDQPQVDQPQVDQPQVDQPQVDQPKVDQPQVDQPQVDQPQVDQPQVDQPQVDQPQVDQPAPQNEGPPAPQDEGPPAPQDEEKD